MMRTVMLSPGTNEPVTVDEAKLYVRVTSGNLEDDLFTRLIAAARRNLEEFARISIVRRAWRTTINCPTYSSFGMGLPTTVRDLDRLRHGFRLPRRPAHEIIAVKYHDRSGEVVPIDESAFTFNVDAGYCYWKDGVMPIPQTGHVMTVEYSAGYANAAETPQEIKMAILTCVADYYENRAQEKSEGVPAAAQYMMRGHWQSATMA